MIAMINTALLRAMTAVASLKARLAEERGQDLLEYALLGGLLATLIIGAGAVLVIWANNPLNAMFDGIQGCIDFNAGGCNPF